MFIDVMFVNEKTVTSPGPRREWFPLAARNSAFFHAIMGASSSHLAYKRNQDGDNVGYFYHRGQAISLVNKAISDGNAATEGIIATVAAFIQQDVGLGRPSLNKPKTNELLGSCSCNQCNKRASPRNGAARQSDWRDKIFSN
jgi:hypothetical protein